ncbi:MAG: cysteine--tRNA ligase [Candidatus Binataceae bacterium]|nr:cysteine--tRNA ligase [Candidatus Binataceae bacterium]
MKPFHIFNSLTRAVEPFMPLDTSPTPTATFYSCGPTVYLPQHLGNMRAYVFVDTLRRALEFNGYTVRHVMNITDVGHMTSDEDAGEDKIEKTARAEGKSPLEVANFYIAQFKRDCAALNIALPIDAVPDAVAHPPQSALCRATDNIPAMIGVIEQIAAHGYAYTTPSGVYFDVEKWRGPSGMGRLSRQSLSEQHAGQRLEHSADKRSPHDFALWVLNQPHHMMQWDFPGIGRGYPGWHIECSAMSMRYLGETIDIHSGGLDHIPVHHENEIAQSESATGHQFVRYFVHNAFLTGMAGAKISKSAGRFPVLDDLVEEKIHPLAFRLLCLGAKYRSELAFSIDAVRAAEKNLNYLNEFVRCLQPRVIANAHDAAWAGAYEERFHEAMNNDLNTPQALAVALELVAAAYRQNDHRIWHTLRIFDMVLGLDLEGRIKEIAKGVFPPRINRLMTEREKARAAKDFKRSDELRAEIELSGYEVKDTKAGMVVMPKRVAP